MIPSTTDSSANSSRNQRNDYDENSGKMLLTLVSRISIIFSFAARTSSGRPATFICGSVKETNYYITMRQYVPPSSCGLRGIAIGEQLLRIDRATRTGWALQRHRTGTESPITKRLLIFSERRFFEYAFLPGYGTHRIRRLWHRHDVQKYVLWTQQSFIDNRIEPTV